MKILLIRPNIGVLVTKRGKDVPFIDKGRMEPLQLGVLAGLTKNNWEVCMLDDRLDTINYEMDANLVAITVQIFTARRSYEIATEFRSRGMPVILGGIHVTLMPDEASRYADSIIISDAESVWNTVLEDFKNKRLKKRYHGCPGPPQAGTMVSRAVYGRGKYFPADLMQFGRGCPFMCSFCATGLYFKESRYCRPVKEVVQEVIQNKSKLIFFVDDNIVGDKELAKELMRALIPLKIKWFGQASLDMTEDVELMQLMQLSGCIGLVLGFESVTQLGLTEYKKLTHLERDYKEKIKIIRRHRIHIWAAFLLGHDEETFESLKATYDFAWKYKFSFAAFNILMPYPKTEVYQKLEKERRLLFWGAWWLHPDYRFNHAAYVPKNMTADELTTLVFSMRKRYNSAYSLIRRLFVWHNLRDFPRLWLLFYTMVIFKVEAIKKQRLRLGMKS